jgi:hypothetical protein
MYQNRLRVDDFTDIFKHNGMEVAVLASAADERALDDLEHGFPLDKRFATKSPATNATLEAWFAASAQALAEPAER